MGRIFADGGYRGEKMARVVSRTGIWKLQIVNRSTAAGFEVLPKRWIVERTFAWISRNRRLVRDFERYASTVAAFVRLAMISIMLDASEQLIINRNFPDGLLDITCSDPNLVRSRRFQFWSLLADIVAKVSNRGATIFPPEDKTGRDRRLIWPQAYYRSRQ